jgi:hypothetical protein
VTTCGQTYFRGLGDGIGREKGVKPDAARHVGRCHLRHFHNGFESATHLCAELSESPLQTAYGITYVAPSISLFLLMTDNGFPDPYRANSQADQNFQRQHVFA